MKVFEQYAACYDTLYRDKDYRGETRFVLKLLHRHGAKTGALLDLGCGTGAYTVLLAERYRETVGVDLSPAMLRCARERRKKLPPRLSKKILFRQGDIRTLRLKKKFDAVLAMFHVMSYQADNRDLARAFKNAAVAVRPGGIFLCDFWHGPGVLTVLPERRVKKVEDLERHITRRAVPYLDVERNTVEVHYDLTVFQKREKTTHRIRERHLVRYLFRPELEELCRQSGIELLEFGEWLTGRRPTRKTWCAYLVGRRVKP